MTKYTDNYQFDKTDTPTRLFCAASDWMDRAVAAEGLVEQLKKDAFEQYQFHMKLRKLLVRLRDWDRLDASHEGVQWRTEIDAALKL